MRLRRRGRSDSPDVPNPVAEAAAQHLAEAIRIRTVTPPDGPLSDAVRAPFDLLRTFLEETFATTFAAAEVEVVGRAGLLLSIPGASSERPVLLMAHQDVVPVPADWEAEGWEHPPFDGVIADGHVHGRGSLDDKGALITLLEAVEGLLADGWTPARDVLLFFGADEEASHASAEALAALLRERGIEPWLTVDEGGAVATGAFPGIKQPLAVIGATEKGALTVRLTASSAGGHASTPPRTSAPGILARAILAIEDTPAPASVHDLTVEMFEQIAPHAPRSMRGVLARAGSLRGLLTRALPRLSPELGAVVRTTYAITQLQGSPA
ncbi:M20/M25/M40 family metallo-hydrolase, partial [uncultured Demequina sp.]|uniref:M20/M25/M40 family metallo-hydrolase n=1 Tax=uncultured Demequina sp. TaxID=693499 RepID=UPI0025D2EB20